MSVVMPVFNAEAYLAEAVESVLGQTLEDLELIAVDDGSKDGSRAILERFARADDRVLVVVNDDNVGTSASRNRGWRMARAPYVAVMDADDVALPDRLARQAGFLDAHPSVAAVGGSEIAIDHAGRRLTTRRYPTSDRVIRPTLLRHNCFAHSAVTIRRAALDAVGGYGLRRTSQDYDLWLRLSERFELANLAEPVVLHRLHAGQLSVSSLERQALEATAASAAARARRATGFDPLSGVEELTSDVLDRLSIDETEHRAALERELIARAAIMAELGDAAQAAELVVQASQTLGPRAARRFAATTELKRADALLRARRPLPAARHVLCAFRHEPRYSLSLVTEWLEPRVPGGGRLGWT